MSFDWNKGLTKEIDDRVRRQSESLKLFYKNHPNPTKENPIVLCGCGCRQIVKSGNVFVNGHNRKNKNPTAEHRTKISNAMKDFRSKPDIKDYYSKLFSGEGNPCYGKAVNEKQLNGLKGGHGWNKGQTGLYKHSEAVRGRMSESRMGEKNPRWNGGQKLRIARAHLKRRNLEYNTLNTQVVGSVGHHITRKHVVYIPKEIHVKNKHILNKPETMVKINWIAIYYLNPAIIPIPKEIIRNRMR